MEIPLVNTGVASTTDASADDVAFILGSKRISRGELVQSAQVLAQKLPTGLHHAINLCSDRYYFTVGFTAALIANVRNMLPANRQTETIANLVDDCGGAWVLVDSDLEPALQAVLEKLQVPVENLRNLNDCSGAAGGNLLIPGSRIAAQVFTSGSTGKPAALNKEWRTLSGTAQLLRRRFMPNQPNMGIVATVPPQHMYGLETTVMMGLFGECTVHAAHPFFPEDIATALRELPPPRLLITTPIHLKSLLKSALMLPQLHAIISATAPLSQEAAAAAEQAWQCPVLEIYGCSEAGSLASRRTASDLLWTMLDDMHIEQVKNTALVSAAHLSEPVPLQDEVRVISSQSFELLGRSADMLNVAGKRASLMQLTTQLQSIEGVEDGVFFLRDPSANGVQRLAALVVTQNSKEEILRALAGVIDPAFLPRPLKKVEELPRNAVGKLTRDALLETLRGAS